MIGRLKNLILKWTNRSMILILRFEKMGSGTIRQVVHYAIKRGTPQMMVAARIDQVLIFFTVQKQKNLLACKVLSLLGIKRLS